MGHDWGLLCRNVIRNSSWHGDLCCLMGYSARFMFWITGIGKQDSMALK